VSADGRTDGLLRRGDTKMMQFKRYLSYRNNHVYLTSILITSVVILYPYVHDVITDIFYLLVLAYLDFL
jgi:hypothetical protein